MLQRIEIGGITINMYSFLNYVGAAVLCLWVLSQSGSFADLCPPARKQTSARRKRMIAAAAFLMITVAGFLLLLVLNRRFGNWFTGGNANYFGSLTAWFIAFLVLPVLLKTPPFKTLDLLTPGLPLSLVISKLACFCWGCCYSFKMPGSFYRNNYTYRYEFPVQLLESAVALLIFLFFLWYRKRPYRPGTLFPLYVIIYSATRFFTEFLRDDLPNVTGVFDAYQIMCVVYVILGLMLIIVSRKEP
ncbi:MAG: prolipoprotein diacylglyceryl transferase [Eubacteriales bacterium]|nr:prolipoprotein diacylglyceryl transferase [Eubacteriales bacterium]